MMSSTTNDLCSQGGGVIPKVPDIMPVGWSKFALNSNTSEGTFKQSGVVSLKIRE